LGCVIELISNYLFIYFTLFIYLFILMRTASSGWAPRKQGEGCTLEDRELPGEPIKAFKVEGIINRFVPFPSSLLSPLSFFLRGHRSLPPELHIYNKS
jgi:hypothetical protein